MYRCRAGYLRLSTDRSTAGTDLHEGTRFALEFRVVGFSRQKPIDLLHVRVPINLRISISAAPVYETQVSSQETVWMMKIPVISSVKTRTAVKRQKYLRSRKNGLTVFHSGCRKPGMGEEGSRGFGAGAAIGLGDLVVFGGILSDV